MTDPTLSPAAQVVLAACGCPDSDPPADEELLNLGNDLMGDCLPCDPDLLLAFARAVLTRWGRPAIQPVPEQGQSAN